MMMLENVQQNPGKILCGKPPLTSVPTGIVEAIARVRQYGLESGKYPRESWKGLTSDDDLMNIADAAYRHFIEYIRNPESMDEDSGLPHLWHAACNIAFLIDNQQTSSDKLVELRKNGYSAPKYTST
jgi:hypothetical protein